jgi:hypothetical protein
METSSYECCYLAKALCSRRLHAKEVVQIIFSSMAMSAVVADKQLLLLSCCLVVVVLFHAPLPELDVARTGTRLVGW